jgi:phage baseplate assembly protein W
MAVYTDLNSINPTSTSLLKDVESVYQGLFNLFNTTPGERLFLPEFGVDIEDILFEVIDDLTSAEIFRRIVEAVDRWEGRVLVDKDGPLSSHFPTRTATTSTSTSKSGVWKANLSSSVGPSLDEKVTS